MMFDYRASKCNAHALHSWHFVRMRIGAKIKNFIYVLLLLLSVTKQFI
jgi:hypothetical protein